MRFLRFVRFEVNGVPTILWTAVVLRSEDRDEKLLLSSMRGMRSTSSHLAHMPRKMVVHFWKALYAAVEVGFLTYSNFTTDHRPLPPVLETNAHWPTIRCKTLPKNELNP